MQQHVFRKDAALIAIRQRIICGSLKAGKIYSEKKLSEDLDISRTPLREAVARLVRDGLIEYIPQVGIRIPFISDIAKKELMKVRRAIETLVVRQLAKSDPLPNLTILDDILLRMERAANERNTIQFLESDTDFHCKIAELTEFYFSANILRTIRDKISIVLHCPAYLGYKKEVV